LVLPTVAPARFDMEFKWTASGEIVLKQVRPYVVR